MEKNEINFNDFLNEVSPEYQEFVMQTHEFLLNNKCKFKLETAKNGFVASYEEPKTKKVIINYVFRKSGLIIRIYGNFINKYMDFIERLPEEMTKAIDKAPACKRLLDPVKCNSRCSMGYNFTIRDTHYQKCRYNCFMFTINAESTPFIKTFIENEIRERNAG